MMNTRRFFYSMACAVRGLVVVFRREQNLRLESYAAAGVLSGGIVFGIERLDAAILILLCASLLAVEITNSVVEHLLDLVKPRLHDQVRALKDAMAGAVLVVSVAVFFGTGLIFFPYIVEALSRGVVQ